ncbi:MAG: hypothetical protein ACLQVI_00210 [Polyangiaceae bacterium]|jgi:hypothetical protein
MVLRASRHFLTLAVLAAAGSATFAACSSNNSTSPGGESDGSACPPTYVPPSSFNPASPTESFTTDVFPILSTSCAFASCHGSLSAPSGGMYLGGSPASVYANIVNVQSTEYPTMARIKPGDPTNSFLLRRIDGDACNLAGCTTTTCAELMPQGGPQLLSTQLDTVRGWVAQGALSDVPDAGATEDSGVTPDASSTPEGGSDAGTDSAAPFDAGADAGDD